LGGGGGYQRGQVSLVQKKKKKVGIYSKLLNSRKAGKRKREINVKAFKIQMIRMRREGEVGGKKPYSLGCRRKIRKAGKGRGEVGSKLGEGSILKGLDKRISRIHSSMLAFSG